MKVQNYLDCGCAIMEDGTRSWCPSCLAPPVAQASNAGPTTTNGASAGTIAPESNAAPAPVEPSAEDGADERALLEWLDEVWAFYNSPTMQSEKLYERGVKHKNGQDQYDAIRSRLAQREKRVTREWVDTLAFSCAKESQDECEKLIIQWLREIGVVVGEGKK